jgi:translocating chain-associated membrane protein 1
MGQEQQLRRMASSRKTTKNPPILSQEFIIQNHADIMSCVAMLFVAGLMFQITFPIASIFVITQHNVTEVNPQTQEMFYFYKAGFKDLATTFFYMIICIVVHAVVQEYGVDKLQRKVHLSKIKTSKFNESGQLLVFSLFSAAFAGYIVSQDDLFTNVHLLWENYPANHRIMSFFMKFFFLVQISYWLHVFPEFYFQKVKREEIKTRSFYAAIHLIFIATAYALNFTRVAICILLLHYIAETVFHFCRLAHFAEKPSIARPGFKFWNIIFVLVRLCSVGLAGLTFWYGLRTSETPHVDLSSGNFNTTFIRLNCLLAVCFLQVWMMWNFINFHLKRVRERTAQQKPRYQMRTNKRKAKKLENEVRNLPEADQDATRALRAKDKKQD